METSEIVVRTEAGHEEIRRRRPGLSSKQRVLLIMIDGDHDAAFHRTQAIGLGLDAKVLEEFEDRGLVRLVDPEALASTGNPRLDHYRKISKLMNDTVVDALGVWAFLFTLKVARSSEVEALNMLLPQYEKIVRKAYEQKIADVLCRRVTELFSAGPIR